VTLALLLCAAALAAPPVLVRERGTNDPVPGAELVLPDGRVVPVDARGAALWPADLPPGPLGPMRIEVRAGAHEPLIVDWDGQEPLRLYLVPLPGAAEIVVEARRDSPSVSRQIIDRERIEKTPGTFDDPLRLLQALPGVASTPEYAPTAGLLSVRGAQPTESQVLLDGIEIPFLYHFQQYGSVVHGRLLDEIALYPSARSAAWGDAVGGVAAVTTRQADPRKVHGGVNLNAITAGAYVQAPATLPGGQRAAFSASARRSFADLGESSNDQYTLWPVFWDYLTRADLRPTADVRWSLMGVGAGDRYGRYVGDTAELDPIQRLDAPDFRFDRGFHGVILNRAAATADAAHLSSAGFVHDRWSGAFADTSQLRVEDSVQVRHVSTLSLTDRLSLGLGGDARAATVQRTAVLTQAWSELAGEAPLLARGVAVDERRSGVVGGLWAEPRVQLGPLRLQPGLRLQGDSDSGALSPEPRLATVLRTAEDQQLRFAAGRTSQAPGLDATSPVTGAPGLGLIRADQAALGYDLAVAGRWELGAELWGTRVIDALDEDPAEVADVVDGRAGGVELTSRYRLRERFFTWASLALGRSFRGDAPADFDQPYAFNFVASWDFAPGWNAGLRYRRSSGLPLTPVQGAVYDGDTDGYRPIYGPENSDRLPDYQKVDLHLERSVALRRWTLVVYGEAWWVPAQNNAMYTVYSYDYTQSATVAGPGFVPLLGARAEL
jgi:hypothetical protein